MKRRTLITVVCAIGSLSSATSADSEYLWDDGTGERALAAQEPGDIAWMNWFPVRPGLDEITAIQIAFSGMPQGVAFTAHVWADPSGFEDPFGAYLLASGSGVTPSGANQWVTIDVPDVTVSKGFFVGIIMPDHPVDFSPALFDTTSPRDRHSWFLVGGSDSVILPDDLYGGGAYAWKLETIINGGGDWLIRADARSSVCAADFNSDGDVNTIDVLAFLNAWTAGEPAADFNQDGTINTLDVLAFLNAWSVGC